MYVKLSDYTKYPSCRYKKHGRYSGEWFRDDIILPLIEKYGRIEFDFGVDDIAGCPPGWIEEVFGGLRRKGISSECIEFIGKNDYVCLARNLLQGK